MKNPVAAAGLILGVIVLAMIAWVFLNPNFASAQIQDYVERSTGRRIEIAGGAKLQFSPYLAIRLQDVTLSNPEGQAGSLMRAEIVTLPVTWQDLIERQMRIGSIALQKPVFNFTNDTAGRASWSDAAMPDGGAAGRVITMTAEDATINYLNESDGQAFAATEADFTATLAENDELSVQGTATLKGRFVRFQTYVKSIARAANDGTPADIDIELPGTRIGFSGRLTTRKTLAFAGQTTVSADESRDFFKWLGFTLPGSGSAGPLSLVAKLDTQGPVVTLAGADVAIGANQLKGKITIDAGRKKPRLEGVLATDLLATGFLTRGIDTNMLTAIDADLKLDAYRLEAGPVRAGPVKLGIRLNEGLLDVQIERAAFAGGTINGSLSLNGVSRVPGFQVTINADALSMKELAPLSGLVKLDAPFTGGATLTASGKSAEELTGTLKGAAAFTMGAGRIEGFDVASLLARLGNEIVPGWPGSGSTPFNALAADFEIEDGIAAMRSFALSGNDFTVTGSGDIDLLRRALDLKFEPKLGTGEAAAPVFPVKLIVEGPWAAPRFYPDIAGILQNPAAGFATLRNMRQAGN